MAVYTCHVDSEYYREQCSQECDTCSFSVPKDCIPDDCCMLCAYVHCEHHPVNN